jgi:D-serine/D-alanine/glycine transporter
LFLSCVLMLSAIAILAQGDSVIDAFTLVTSMSTTLFMAVWTIITVCYLVWVRRRPEQHRASSFRAPGGAASAWVVLAFMAALSVVLCLEATTRAGLIAAAVWLSAVTVVAVVHRHRMLVRAQSA